MRATARSLSRQARVLVLALLASSFVVLNETPAGAAVTFTVDSTTDAVDANPGDGNCASAAGECTLRAAVMESNANPVSRQDQFPENTIRMPGGVFNLNIEGKSEDGSATGDLDITTPVEIIGVGTGAAPNATVIGGSRDRYFHFHDDDHPAAFSRLKGMRMAAGDPADGEDGGLILTEGDANLVIQRVELGGVESMTGNGGAIANHAFLQMEEVLVAGNSACNGGGIFSSSVPGATEANLQIEKSLIIQNTSADLLESPRLCAGGGIWTDNLTNIQASTISGNGAVDPGGGIKVGDLGAFIRFTTIADNNAPQSPSGGGLFSEAAAGASGNNLRLEYSVLARNTPDNCGGVDLQEFNENLEDGTTCGFVRPGSISGQDPQLSAFPVDTGGFTQTYEFTALTSPAIDGVPGAANCAGDTDQRLAYRPFDGDKDGTERCDFGALEVIHPIPRVVTLSLSGNLQASGEVNDSSPHIIAASCGQKVPVKIQRKSSSGWTTVKTTQTNLRREYSTRIPDQSGRYRAMAPPAQMPGRDIYTCQRAVSEAKNNT